MGVVLLQRLIALDPGEPAEIPGPADADRRVDQDVGLGLLRRGHGDLPGEPMHGPGRVESDYPPPAELVEQVPELLGGMAQVLVVVVGRQLDALHRAAHVDRPTLLLYISDAGMDVVVGGVDELALAIPVGLPQIRHGQHRQHEPLVVPQREPVAGREGVREIGGHVQGDRDGPDGPVRERAAIHHGVVGLPVHEARERREGTAHEQLEITELTLGKGQGRHVQGRLLERLGARLVHQQRCEGGYRGLCVVSQARVLDEFKGVRPLKSVAIQTGSDPG